MAPETHKPTSMPRLVGAEDAETLATLAAVRAAEEAVVFAIALTPDTQFGALPSRLGRPMVSRANVLERVIDLVGASDGTPLYVRDLCDAAGVSERTLRSVFHESFGIGPIRYLRLRQLRRIRAALRVADPDSETVTKVASDFGVWDLSRFAREYRAVFGEAPSQTLRNRADRQAQRE